MKFGDWQFQEQVKRCKRRLVIPEATENQFRNNEGCITTLSASSKAETSLFSDLKCSVQIAKAAKDVIAPLKKK